MQTLALYSSARTQGNTYQLLQQVSGYWPLDIIHLDELAIASYDYEHRNRGDDFDILVERMLAADNIILASPVYWYAVTPTMKAFIDRLTDLTERADLQAKGKALRNKSFYIACTSTKPEVPKPFYDMLSATLNYLGFPLKGLFHADCTDGYRHSNMVAVIEQVTLGIDHRRETTEMTVNH